MKNSVLLLLLCLISVKLFAGIGVGYSAVGVLTKVETEVALPKNFELNQNYPNPFNPSTTISYSLPTDSKVTLEVYNTYGERIAQLVNETQSAGFYSVNFGSSSLNKNVSSGVYFYRIIAVDNDKGNQFTSIKKMIFLK